MDTNVTELRLSYRDYGDRARPEEGINRLVRVVHPARMFAGLPHTHP